MNRSPHILDLLDDYLDGAVPPEVRRAVDEHLGTCDACRAEHARRRALAAALGALPRELEPPRDLWPGIADRLTLPDAPTPARDGRADRAPQRPTRRRRWRVPVAVAAVLVLLGVGFWMMQSPVEPAWDVAALEGAPRIGEQLLGAAGALRPGEWLETDARSRAALDVGLIGNVEVGPSTRLQLRAARPTDHRLALAEGTIHARIWAPPRLFIVETPEATAVDLGCEYTLTVDSTGAGLLHVTSGYVALERQDRAVVVPAGAMARVWPGRGPGTPFDEDAPPVFREALDRLDTGTALPGTLAALLDAARRADVTTLWYLLAAVEAPERARVYDRLVALVPPPEGVTREGTLSGAPRMLETWHHYLGLHDAAGPSFDALKKKKKQARNPL